jgi:hypothetical protein
MVKEVVWTIRATKTYWQIISYLQNEFGEQSVIEFVNTDHNKIELIHSNPFLFRKSASQKNVFLTSIHKRTTLVYPYRPIKKSVQLLVFWSTRMDFRKLKF